MECVIQLLGSFFGSLGFTVVFRVRREKALIAAFGGLLGWAAYLLAGSFMTNEAPRYFLAAAVVAVYAEIMARVMKCPSTLFQVIGTIPLVPGGSLYRTMAFFMVGDYPSGSAQGLTTLVLAVAIAVGMLFPVSAVHLVRRSREVLGKKSV